MSSFMSIDWLLNRRQYLGQLGLSGVALSSLLVDQHATGAPMAHFAPRAKNVIFLFMVGGASQLETFDPKPHLQRHQGKKAKEIFTAKELAGFNPEKTFDDSLILPSVFPFAQHGQCGAWVSDIYPQLSTVVDDLTFIKSMKAASPIHVIGEVLMHTGYPRKGHPCLGSWVTYGLGSENQNMPGFIVMTDGRSSAGRAVHDSAYLPGVHQATMAKVEGNRAPIDHLIADVDSPELQRRQLELLQTLNENHQSDHPTEPELTARIRSFETAFQMQSEAPEIFDLRRETRSTLELYGDSDFGRKCLTARRLVEQGVRFVEILDGAKGRRWDAHGHQHKLSNHQNLLAKY